MVDGVQALIDNNLLQYVVSSEGEPRLKCLEMIRQYAQIQLVESGELDEARDAHAYYYLTLAKEAESNVPGADQLACKERLERERGNLQAALRWLIASNRPGKAQPLSLVF